MTYIFKIYVIRRRVVKQTFFSPDEYKLFIRTPKQVLKKLETLLIGLNERQSKLS